MMAETVVYAREYLYIEELRERASSAKSSSCRRAISRTWTAGPTTGPACRRCGTPRIASARCSRSPARQRGIRELLRLRHDPPELIKKLQFALRRRDRAHQAQGQRSHRAHHPQPLRHRAAVSRIHRRLRLEKEPSNGRSSSTSRTSCTPPRSPSRRSRKKIKVPDFAKRLPEADPALHHRRRV
jgi:hypothetical protein